MSLHGFVIPRCGYFTKFELHCIFQSQELARIWQKIAKNSNAAPLPLLPPPHLRLNIDTCISFCNIEKHRLKQLLQTAAIFNTKSQQIIVSESGRRDN